jgi:hypothetical protein
MTPTVYKSVDAAVDDLITELPTLQAMKLAMEAHPRSKTDLEHYEKLRSAIAMLSDREALRARLERLKRPDGSVQFSFTAEAWNLLNQK